MTTVPDLIDFLKGSNRGRIFLVNLDETLANGFDAQLVKEVCEELAISIDTTPHTPLSADDLATDIGMRCTSRELWRHAAEPSIERYGLKRGLVLTRMTTYGAFFRYIMRRQARMPRRGVPDPRNVDSYGDTEIAEEDISTVREYIDSGAWKALDERTDVDFESRCIWIAPLAELLKRQVRCKRALPDFYRDMIGLCDMHPGEHLIRLDFELNDWPNGPQVTRRRPHGAGNGGARFRMSYDGPSSCNWGRTVNLGVLAKHRKTSLNGIPEMLMQPFSVPKSAIKALYVGEITQKAEQDDEYFLRRLTTAPIDQIAKRVKERLL